MPARFTLIAENRQRMVAAFEVEGMDEVVEMPIARLYDADGRITDNWDEATAYICGAEDLWLTLRVFNGGWPTYH